ncbi:hypothetical protein CBL_12421 [Carabus blaptoides fortunei]
MVAASREKGPLPLALYYNEPSLTYKRYRRSRRLATKRHVFIQEVSLVLPSIPHTPPDRPLHSNYHQPFSANSLNKESPLDGHSTRTWGDELQQTFELKQCYTFKIALRRNVDIGVYRPTWYLQRIDGQGLPITELFSPLFYDGGPYIRCLTEQNGMRIASWTLFRTILGGITKDLRTESSEAARSSEDANFLLWTLRRISFQDGAAAVRVVTSLIYLITFHI